MENSSFNNVADLSHEQRLVVESIVGESLHPDDQLFLSVLHPGRQPTAEAKSRVREKLERLFAKSDARVDEIGISDDEADAIIDKAVHKVRAQGI